MARKTVYIPDELIEQLERSGTDIGQKLSREFQDYLRSRLAMAASPQWSGDFESAAEICKLETQDVASVVQIWDDTDDGWHLTELARRRVTDNLQRTIDHPDAFCLVARLDDRVIGFVTASISGHPVMPGRSSEIEEISVHRDFRRRRIGSDLMKAALQWLDGGGLRPIRCVYPSEDAAWLKPFLLSLGFECDQSVANIWSP
jgi:GNAT superfamily N-acetyltransferase